MFNKRLKITICDLTEKNKELEKRNKDLTKSVSILEEILEKTKQFRKIVN